MHKEQEQDVNIKKMAKYLREGAKMLDIACPVCNNPIFQFKTGEKACVVCERPVILEQEDTRTQEQSKEVIENEHVNVLEVNVKNEKINAAPTTNDLSLAVANLRNACIKKMEELTNKLTRTENENDIKNLMGIIYQLLEVLEKIRF